MDTFANVVLTLIIFILILGIIVFIHELGHFIAAKKAGVVVQEFAFGFGPKLWGKKWRGTEYKLNLYPVGGYCKMLGDQDGSSFLRYNEKEYDKADKEYTLELLKKHKLDPKKNDFSEIEAFIFAQQKVLSEKEYLKVQNYMLYDYIPHHPGNFDNVSKKKRAVIVSAGVIMNFVLGVLIYYVYFLITGFYVDVPKIGNPSFIGAEVANIPYYETLSGTDNALTNSIVIKAEGQLIKTPAQFQQLLREKYDQTISLDIQRITDTGYEFKTVSLVLNGEGYKSVFDEDLYLAPVISKVGEQSLAEVLGLKVGDVLLSLQGQSLSGDIVISKIFANYQQQDVMLEVLSDGEIKDIFFTVPQIVENKSVLGVSYYNNNPYPAYLLRVNYLDNKWLSGFDHAINMTAYNVSGLVELVRESIAKKSVEPVASSVSSVVGVSKVVYTLVEVKDFTNILNLAALISLSLAVMNILPIPLFDGGHLVFLVLEKVRGRKLSANSQEKISMIAFYTLIILSVVIVFKDILSFDFVQQIIKGIGSIFSH